MFVCFFCLLSNSFFYLLGRIILLAMLAALGASNCICSHILALIMRANFRFLNECSYNVLVVFSV